MLEGMLRIGIDADAGQIGKLAVYMQELERWNQRFHLVRACGTELAIRHVLDSIAGVPIVRRHAESGRILDVGTGAGLPGVPLAILLPECRVTLLERSSRKASFLENVTLDLNLANAEVCRGSLETITERFDVVTFRAFGSPFGRIIAECSVALVPRGKIVAYKGRLVRILEDIATVDPGIAHIEIVRVTVPFLAAERHLVVVRVNQRSHLSENRE